MTPVVLLMLAFDEHPVPSHPCAHACLCPCSEAKPCDCDGRTCLVEIWDPTEHHQLHRVENSQLPKWPVACPDRPLSKGKTYRPRTPKNHGQAWICNDPMCPFCHQDNAAFRQQPTDP